MDFSNWLIFAAVVIAATISPGPNVLIVIFHSLQSGYKAAIYTVAGNITALFIYALISAAGVGALLQVYPQYLYVFRLIGALYLIYLGLKLIFSKPAIVENRFAAASSAQGSQQRPENIELFKGGFYCSLSNPKAVLFLSSIFPQFILPNAPIVPQFIVMFLTIIASVSCIHMLYAMGADKAQNLVTQTGLNNYLTRITGSCFIVFGVLLAPFRRA